MTFRRSDDAKVGSERWCAVHRSTLARWLPQAVVDSPRAIVYVLLHGDDELGTGWSTRWLTPDDAAAFLAFLERELAGAAGRVAVAVR